MTTMLVGDGEAWNVADQRPGPGRIVPPLFAVWLGVWGGLGWLLPAPPIRADVPSPPHQRQPIRIVETAGGLLVANHRSGTVSQFSLGRGDVAAELSVGRELSDLAGVAGGSLCVATDPRGGELLALAYRDGRWQVVGRQAVSAEPVSVIVTPTTRRVTVASLWSHQLSQWTLAGPDVGQGACQVEFRPIATLDLPFAPRLQCLVPDQRHLIVADAFGPYLAVVRVDPLELQAVFQIPGHNIRGLATSADGRELLIAHQMLNDFIPTTRDHVFWGNVVSNLLRSLEFDKLLDGAAHQAARPVKIHGTLYPLGKEGQAAGDPEQIVVTSRGDTLVALAGTGEIAFRRRSERLFRRLPVGQRPTGLWVSADGARAFVANRFDDTLAEIDLDNWQLVRSVSLGPAPLLTPADQGERLFYDATRSLHGWFSCHSCHTDGHSCGLLNDNFGDDTLGTPKRIPSLLGTAETGPWAWSGQQTRLSDQIHKSLRLTMRGDEQGTIATTDVDALVAYLQTLRPPPSVAVARNRVDTAAVARGQRLFAQQECTQCHAPPTYTTPDTYDVGLRDERGATEFNPPSLRGLGQRPRLLHDGRCRSVREVLAIHPRPEGVALSDVEMADLVAFLESL